jgi:aldehyde:ferredoxin oxidoreductase
MGIHPTRNYTQGVNPGRKAINAEAIKSVQIGDRACASCPLGCGNFTSVNEIEVEGPEYETLCMVGSNCGINDLEQVMHLNRLCDDLGLDTMSIGGTIALAMDLTESGVRDFGLKFGQAGEFLAVAKEIAYLSTDRGRELAQGAAKLDARYGESQKTAHAKGLEMPAYDPRGSYGMGLAYATSERGACHLRAFTIFAEDPFKLDAMAKDVISGQNANAVKWCMCFCDFWGSVDTQIMAGLLSAGLGRQFSAEDLDMAGERIWNLLRLYNVRAGFTAADDVLSDKVMKKALGNGPHEGRVLRSEDLEAMKSLYYHLRGWSADGVPGEKKLKKLGLDDLAVN